MRAKRYFIFVITFLLLPIGAHAGTEQKFSTPEAAAQALGKAVQSQDPNKSLEALFGKEAEGLWNSGDPVQDEMAKKRFLERFAQSQKILAIDDQHSVIYLGNDSWPFPIPLLKQGKAWSFDVPMGKQEILNRRIGANELDAIDSARDYVKAQQEYFQMKIGGTADYAQKFISDPGKKNGLYWDSQNPGDQSPIGPRVTNARAEGYGPKDKQGEALLYHGYYYRILSAQGKNAPGGEKNYLKDGKMTGGFALIAFPAKPEDSGVMTFLVNQDGQVLQKNLGKDTLKIAEAIQSYDPDKSWSAVSTEISHQKN